MSFTKPYAKVKVADILNKPTAGFWAKIIAQPFEQQEDLDNCLHNLPSLNGTSVHDLVDLQK